MNGSDHITGVLTLIIILIFSPLLQWKETVAEAKNAMIRKAVEENKDEPEYILTMGEILNIHVTAVSIAPEGEIDSEIYPYFYREADPKDEDLKKGRLIYYEF
ncbi:MAG: hypothetical protein IJS80_07350 [Lachnospiraceae bacterium]|nr:hypothetical protein [Lachnospiraceae bacterium]